MTEERIDILSTKNLNNVLRHVERYTWAARIAYGRVIDVACGTGYGTALIAGSNKVKSILGIDLSEEAILLCRQRYGRAGKKLSFKIGDALTVSGAQTIVSFETIEHLEAPGKFLDRVHHVLDPEGRLLISVPLDEHEGQNKYHLHTFTEKSFKKLLLARGFYILSSWYQEDLKNRTLIINAIPK